LQEAVKILYAIITQEEFDIMVQEELNQRHDPNAMLCQLTERVASPIIQKFCNSVPCLKGRQLEEDFLHDVYALAMAGIVHKFLRKNGLNAPINGNPEELVRWLTTVTKNWMLAYIRKHKDRITVPLDEELWHIAGDDPEEMLEKEGRRAQLRQAMDIALDADAGVYKVLTWVAMCTFMLGYDITKIESNSRILTAFDERTLNEMYEMIRAESVRIPWMQISPERDKAIRRALQEPFGEGRTYGETTYSEFYMKYQGAPSGKKSVSDWVNRMNGNIRKQLTDPPEQNVPKLKKPKRCPQDTPETDSKRSGGNAGSTQDENTRRDENASSNS
jgi:hypothetical protein